jgi:hypothetical protein
MNHSRAVFKKPARAGFTAPEKRFDNPDVFALLALTVLVESAARAPFHHTGYGYFH